MPEKNNPKEAMISPQQLVALYQNQRSILDKLNQQEQALVEAISRIKNAKTVLKEIKSSKKGVNSMFSLGAGVFIGSKVTSEDIKSDIGGGIVESVSIKKAIEQVNERKENTESSLSKVRDRKKEAISALKRTENMLSQIQQAMKEKQRSPQSIS